MEDPSPLARAISAAGSQAALSDRIGVSQQLISYWLRKGARGVPAEHVSAIEMATGISRHELRPDVFGAKPAEKASAA
jgi:DNA-binding transcriptional regulator YdaS (Cro superfamily)